MKKRHCLAVYVHYWGGSNGKIKARPVSDLYGYQMSLEGNQMFNGLPQGKLAESELPNTTVYHPIKTTDQAAADIKAVAQWARAALEKYLAF